jgi:hypothetical protein
MLTSSAVECAFKPPSGQTKDLQKLIFATCVLLHSYVVSYTGTMYMHVLFIESHHVLSNNMCHVLSNNMCHVLSNIMCHVLSNIMCHVLSNIMCHVLSLVLYSCVVPFKSLHVQCMHILCIFYYRDTCICNNLIWWVQKIPGYFWKFW